MKSLLITVLIGLATGLSATLSWAEASDRYIIDTIYVSLRSGPGDEFRIVKASLPSGTKMTATGLSDNKQWTQVTVIGNEPLEGWIPSRYVSNTPIAKDALVAAQAKIEALTAQLANPTTIATDAPINADQEAQVAIIAERDALLEDLNRIKAVSGNAIVLDQRNGELLLENQELKTQLDILKIENQYLSESNNTREWMIGGMIAFFGLLAGLMLSRIGMPSRRSNSWA